MQCNFNEIVFKEGHATHLLATLDILDHVLVRLIRSVYTRLRPLYWQRKRVHDHQRRAHDLALHQAHDLVRDA